MRLTTINSALRKIDSCCVACFNSTSSPTWEGQLGSDDEAGGFSLQGKIGEKFSFGADVQYSHIEDQFDQSAVTPNAVIPTIPMHRSIVGFEQDSAQRISGASIVAY